MKRAALVLSGGGALGAAHLGVLQSLTRQYKFDFFAGVSAGAIVTGFFASGFTPNQVWDILRQTRIFSNMLDPAKNNFGLVAGKRFTQLLKEYLGDVDIDQLQYPLYIGATDFKTGKNLAMNRGKLIDAIRASISVPVLFSPHYHPFYKLWLVDGGLTQNFPLDVAINHYEGDHIIGIDVIGQIDTEINFAQSRKFPMEQISNIQLLLDRSLRIMLMNQQAQSDEDARVQVIRPPLFSYTSRDINKMAEIYQIGLRVGEEFISDNT